MTAGVLGPAAIWAAMILTLTAVATGRRRLLGLGALASVLAIVVLLVALLMNDFSLQYVARTTSLATPWPYRLAALWGGMDGSMLFYCTLSLVVAWLGLRDRGPVRVGAVVGLGLLAVTIFFANPFFVPEIPAVDGQGLLAILQHPAMIYHPPILYLGLVVLVVPFALTIAMAERAAWRQVTRRWLYVSWTLLTFGMAFGASWAYIELGWGGFWAWDPVENTALMPWLATTVFLHTSRIEEMSGRMRRWNVLFASLPFALSVMGVYLTRSGATGSIHSFAEDPVVGRILLGATVVTVVVVAVVALRSQRGDAWPSFRLDRQGWLLLNGVLVAAALVFVTAGSAYPAYLSVFGGQATVVDSQYFVLTVLPVAVMIALGLALGLRADWRLLIAGAALAIAMVWLIAGISVDMTLLAAAFAALGSLALRAVRIRPSGRLRTAYVAHLGMALFLVAVAGSSLGAEFTGTMSAGEQVEVGGHTIALIRTDTGETDRYLFVRSSFEVDGSPLAAEIRAYEEQATPVAEPALRWGFVDDVIVATSLLFPDGETVAVSVFVRPLVMWVWVGALVIGLAGLLAIFGRGEAAEAPRPTATAGRRTRGTATDTVVP